MSIIQPSGPEQLLAEWSFLRPRLAAAFGKYDVTMFHATRPRVRWSNVDTWRAKVKGWLCNVEEV